jgi:hypothetical protein
VQSCEDMLGQHRLYLLDEQLIPAGCLKREAVASLLRQVEGRSETETATNHEEKHEQRHPSMRTITGVKKTT